MFVGQIAEYLTSRDHLRLAELAKTSSIICLVDHGEVRDVARTLYAGKGAEDIWQVSARGINYVYATTLEEFVASCVRANVEFIEP